MESSARGQGRAKLVEKRGEALPPKQKRLAPVQHDTERVILRPSKLAELLRDRRRDAGVNPLRLLPPALVAHMVDVAVRAVEITAAGYLHQNSVDDLHRKTAQSGSA